MSVTKFEISRMNCAYETDMSKSEIKHITALCRIIMCWVHSHTKKLIGFRTRLCLLHFSGVAESEDDVHLALTRHGFSTAILKK